MTSGTRNQRLLSCGTEIFQFVAARLLCTDHQALRIDEHHSFR